MLLLLLCVTLAGVLIGLRIARWNARRRLRRSRQRGIAAEEAAACLLRNAGYEILDSQVERRYGLAVGGNEHEATVRADLLVAHRGRTYIVEVKTGAGADPMATATRRQLLEYRHAFAEVDGVLLADMERGLLLEVVFDRDQAAARGSWLMVATVLVALATAVLTMLTAFSGS